jgi:hypothetical protein
MTQVIIVCLCFDKLKYSIQLHRNDSFSLINILNSEQQRLCEIASAHIAALRNTRPLYSKILQCWYCSCRLPYQMLYIYIGGSRGLVANALGLTVLLGGGCRRFDLRSGTVADPRFLNRGVQWKAGGVWELPWSLQWVQGKTLVGVQGAKPPEGD